MSKETYIKWDHPTNPVVSMMNTSICFDMEGFRMIFQENESKDFHRIRFDYHYFVQWCDEGSKLKTVLSVERPRCMIYEILNSNLLEKFFEEGCSRWDASKGTFKHFSIWASDMIIDVITNEEPVVERLPIDRD